MNKDVMNQGVQILLDRMDTNPEEFEDGREGKWSDIVQAVHARVKERTDKVDYGKPLPFLTDPEVNALYDKLEDVRRENFTADVLRRLASAPLEQYQEDLFGNPPHIGTPLKRIELMSEREKQDILDAIEGYHDAEEKKNGKKATAR